MNFSPVGVHAAHDVTDGAVLARRIHGLEDEEQAVAVVGVHHVLQGVDLFAKGFQALAVGCLVGVELFLSAGGVTVETEAFSTGDAVIADLDLSPVFHGSS